MIEKLISIEAQCLQCAMARSGGPGQGLAIEVWVDQHRTAFGHTVQITRVSEVAKPANEPVAPSLGDVERAAEFERRERRQEKERCARRNRGIAE